jgi:hypothetical protein
MLVHFLIRKPLWKKKELKGAMEDEIKKQGAQYPDKDLDKLINMLTQQAGGGQVQLKKP